MAKIGGIEAKDFRFVRNQIDLHFGSISVFSKVTGMPYRKTLAMFKHQKIDKALFGRLEVALRENVERGSIPFRISNEDRKKIRICILTDCLSYTEFEQKHPEFDVVYISNITNTINGLKLKSQKYLKLIALLKKEYGLELKIN